MMNDMTDEEREESIKSKLPYVEVVYLTYYTYILLCMYSTYGIYTELNKDTKHTCEEIKIDINLKTYYPSSQHLASRQQTAYTIPHLNTNIVHPA